MDGFRASGKGNASTIVPTRMSVAKKPSATLMGYLVVVSRTCFLDPLGDPLTELLESRFDDQHVTASRCHPKWGAISLGDTSRARQRDEQIAVTSDDEYRNCDLRSI